MQTLLLILLISQVKARDQDTVSFEDLVRAALQRQLARQVQPAAPPAQPRQERQQPPAPAPQQPPARVPERPADVLRMDIPEHTAFSEAQLAINDLHTLPRELWTDVRYMTSYAVKPGRVKTPFVNVDELGVISDYNEQTRLLEPTLTTREAELPQLLSLIASFGMNSLSLQATTFVPTPVPGTNGRIIRFQLSNYGLTPEVWDTFTATEPYFQDIDYPGLEVYTGNYRPIIRTDWFLANAFYEPNYSNLLYASTTKPTTEDEFITTFGFDIDAVKVLQRDRGHVVSGFASAVAFNDRRLQRYSGVLDYLYRTNDFADNIDRTETRTVNGKTVTVTLQRDPSENLLSNAGSHVIFDVDAGELITQLPNGLQGYAITNKQKKIVNDADVNVVRDTLNISNDPIVRNAASCIWCHGKGLNVPGNNSLINVGVNKIADIKSYTPEVVIFLQKFYSTDFGRFVREDQRAYQHAVAMCNGLEAGANAQYFQYFISQYKYTELTAEDAARELGVTPQRLFAVAKAGYSKGLIDLFGPTPIPMQRELWEAKFQTFKLIQQGAVDVQ